eukprot:5052717-Amphidinium_carterae.1
MCKFFLHWSSQSLQCFNICGVTCTTLKVFSLSTKEPVRNWQLRTPSSAGRLVCLSGCYIGYASAFVDFDALLIG